MLNPNGKIYFVSIQYFMKKYLRILVSVSFILLFKQSLFSQNWQWTKHAGGTNHEYASCTRTDIAGNVYVCGYFKSPSITFGTITLTNTQNNKYDMFLVKYNSSGTAIWAQKGGGTKDDFAYSISVDTSGNVIVVGNFTSTTATFGTTTLTESSGLPSPAGDAFIAKYNKNGVFQWALNPTCVDYDEANGVATDVAGNIFVTGDYFNSSIIFGSTTLSNTGGPTQPYDIFTVKLNPAGAVLWGKKRRRNRR